MKHKHTYYLSLIGLCCLLIGCTVKYSFTGASISPDVKTVSIKYFPNMASHPEPSLSDVYTQAMRDKFTSETNLSNVRTNGDIQFEGEITGFVDSYEAVQSDETAAKRRLTITVKVLFTNTNEPLKSYNKSFSAFETYDSNQSLETIKENLIRVIVDDLVDQVFMEAVANW